jgi:hypothetical protein
MRTLVWICEAHFIAGNDSEKQLRAACQLPSPRNLRDGFSARLAITEASETKHRVTVVRIWLPDR